jgi:hypothetical protein
MVGHHLPRLVRHADKLLVTSLQVVVETYEEVPARVERANGPPRGVDVVDGEVRSACEERLDGLMALVIVIV